MIRKNWKIYLIVVSGVYFTLLGLLSARAELGNSTSQSHFWTRECLTCDQSILPGHIASLDIDQQGYPHIISDVTNSITNTYTILDIYQDALGWHSEIVDDTTDFGLTLLMRLDSNNKEHILYDESELYIKYAYRDQSGWHIQQIFTFADFGAPLTAQIVRVDSMVLDSQNRPHATIQAIINRGLTLVYYIYLTETGWQKEEIGAGEHGAVALDSSDMPHIAYVTAIEDGFTVVDRILSYTYRDGSGWHTEEVAHQVGTRVAIAVDGVGFPHIASQYYYPMEYHHKDGCGWHRETLGGGSEFNPHILLNSLGKPFIGINDGHISYFFWGQNGWESGGIQNPYYYTAIGMAMDGDEGIHFAFRETSTYDVIYLSPYTGTIYSMYMPVVNR